MTAERIFNGARSIPGVAGFRREEFDWQHFLDVWVKDLPGIGLGVAPAIERLSQGAYTVFSQRRVAEITAAIAGRVKPGHGTKTFKAELRGENIRVTRIG